MDEKRLAGVVLPLFSLRRNNDHGIPILTALRQWIDWAADAHVFSNCCPSTPWAGTIPHQAWNP